MKRCAGVTLRDTIASKISENRFKIERCANEIVTPHLRTRTVKQSDMWHIRNKHVVGVAVMGESIEALIEYWHNKGEQDYPSWKPPTKSFLFELVEGNNERELAIAKAYRAGYANARKVSRT